MHTDTFSFSKLWLLPITVAAWSKAGIVDLIPAQDTDVCVRLFYVYVVPCAGSGLATGSSPVQGSYRLCIWLRN
jgi:hypothetical protein